MLKTGDIVFARRGEIGRCALVTEKENGYLCGTGSLFVRFIKNQNSRFVIKLFSSSCICNQLLANASGATMLNINSTIVEDLHFYLPSSEEQDSILARLDTLNEKCKTLQANYEKTIALCDDLKQALLKKAFDGEI
ncbi:MAG: restriction endonuclease subunit S [Bacteroidales bacterium]|nr:restriction endonuclease subunit S [Bacteroidales bacterium]